MHSWMASVQKLHCSTLFNSMLAFFMYCTDIYIGKALLTLEAIRTARFDLFQQSSSGNQ